MTDADDIAGFRLNGREASADVLSAITSATVERTLEGASTLSISLRDPDRKLTTSRLFASAVTATLDRTVFELVQQRKSGSNLDLTFEDAVVTDLRRARTKPGRPTPTAAAGKSTVDAFARRLVAEAPGARLVAFGGQRNLAPLMRGTSSDRYENSWDCLLRLADERGWRCFTDRGTVFLGPDSWLLGRVPKTVVREYEQGVEEIDWDFDGGKRAARASFTVSARRWALPPGSPVTVQEQGLGSGDWLVESTSRSLYSAQTEVVLVRAQPALPEPKPEPRDDGQPSSAAPGAVGGQTVQGPVSKFGFSWPLSGTVRSGFGQRGGKLHAGVDITCPIGTPVASIGDGTVTFAGTAGGYGTAIYIDHGGTTSRYGHLSQLAVRRGQVVKRGERIGLSGNTGNSSGPHLHLEVRPGDVPKNPLDYLPARR